MKKTVYTIAFVALFSVMANAQSSKQAKLQPAKETVNPDGTVNSAPAPALAPASADNVKHEKAAEAKPAGGTRMAITEKGVPAKKAAEPKKAEPAKTEKH